MPAGRRRSQEKQLYTSSPTGTATSPRAREGTEPGPSTGDEVDRPPPSIENNPYRNLSAFQEEDAAVFYGRDALVRETLATFYGLIDPKGAAQIRLLAILGPSGSGKSSFARAGLAAQLNLKAPSRGLSQTFCYTARS